MIRMHLKFLPVQSEVAQKIVNALNVKLTTEEGKRIIEKSYRIMLRRMRSICRQKNYPGRKGIETVIKCNKKDPNFSLAWAELASAYSKNTISKRN